MAKLAGDMLTEEAIEQRQRRDCRQRQADGPPRHLQHSQQQDGGDGDLKPALEKTILIRQRLLIPRDPERGQQARRPKRRPDPPTPRRRREGEHRPWQCERHVQRTADEVGGEAGKDQP